MNLEQGDLEYRGLRIHYQASGIKSGIPVVMIHGWASSAGMWTSTMLALQEHCYCVALDLPGHGGSHFDSALAYSLPNLANLLEQSILQLDLQRAIVIGHSMGGSIALLMASRAKVALRRMVVINPVVDGLFGAPRLDLERRLLPPLAAMTNRFWPLAASFCARPPTMVERFWPVRARRWREGIGRTSSQAASAGLLALREATLSPLLNGLRVPTLFILGDRDWLVPPYPSLQAAQRMLSSEVAIMPAGHHPFDEAPEIYHPTLERFILHPGYSNA
jgi:pimeloyl-ACP methyl ester carboxylesterase